MGAKYDENEFIESLTNPLLDTMQEVQYNVLAVITERIKKIGALSPSDAQRMAQLVRMEDLKTIESVIQAGTNLSIKQIENIFDKACENNDLLAENLYKARNMQPSNFKADTSLLNVLEQAKKTTVDGIANLSETTGFFYDGKFTETGKAYVNAINSAVFQAQQGLFDYATVTRNIIKNLSASGLRTVDFESGYHRRLDSQVWMNTSDGIRQMNMAYRKKQSEQYGGNHVFISMHGLCATDHQKINGMDYTEKEWERVSSSLDRQVGTWNCKHYITYGITGISKNPYSDKERAEAIASSNAIKSFQTLKKDANGNYIDKKVKAYDMSQIQRQTETKIRQLKDVANQLELAGDSIGANEYNSRAKKYTAYYKSICKQAGVEPDMTRLRVYKPK